MAKEVHIGEKAKAVVKPFDAQGRPTSRWDKASGITWAPTDPGTQVTDGDTDPLDADIEFTALSEPGVDQTIDVSFDGDPGDGVRPCQGRSEPYQVVEGEAVGGTVELIFEPV